MACERVTLFTNYLAMPLAHAKARLRKAKAARSAQEAQESDDDSKKTSEAMEPKITSISDALSHYEVTQANRFHRKLQQAMPSTKFHLQSGTAGTMVGTARANSLASVAPGYDEEHMIPYVSAETAEGMHLRLAVLVLWQSYRLHMEPLLQLQDGTMEVTLGAAVAEGLRVQSEDLTGEAGRHRTEVLVQMSDLEACHLDPSGGEVRLLGRGLRDFAKAAEVFARDLDSLRILDGSALLELRFGAASGSVLCSLAVALEGVAREIQGFRADFDAFPEHSQRAVIDLTQLSSAPAAPAAPASPAGPAVPAVRASQGLPLFTAQQKAQMATQLSTQPEVPPSMPPPTVPATPLPSQNGRSQEIPGSTGSWWQGRATPPAQVMASLSRPAVSASPAPQPGVGNVGNTVLASHLENTDVLDSDDELIGADPDEIAFARGDQEEEAPDWFDCEKLWTAQGMAPAFWAPAGVRTAGPVWHASSTPWFELHWFSLFVGVILGLCLGPILEALVGLRLLLYQAVIRRLVAGIPQGVQRPLFRVL
eukprot:s3148_g5.t1